MNKKIATTLLIGLALFTASGLAAAKSQQTKNNPPPPCHCGQETDFVIGWHNADFPEMKQLSPEQQKVVKDILADAQTKIAPQLQLLRAKNVMLNAQLMQPKVDKNAVAQLAQEINTLRAQLLQQRIDTALLIKDKAGVSFPL